MTNDNTFKFSVPIDLSNNPKEHVIYMHHTPIGELLYIGMDLLTNMFNYNHLSTNTIWKQKVQQFNGKYTVSLYEIYSSRADAARVRSMLCNRLKPIAQVRTKASPDFIRCITTNMYYLSASQAAKANGINPSVMSRHLNRYKGFMSVYGLTFERVIVEELPDDAMISLVTGEVTTYERYKNNIPVKPVTTAPQEVDTDKQLTEARLQEMYARDRLTALPDDTETYEQFKVAMVAALAGDGYVYIPDAPTAPDVVKPLYEAYKPDLRARRDMSEEDMVQVHNHYLMENKMPRFPPMTMDEFKQWLTDNDEWAE